MAINLCAHKVQASSLTPKQTLKEVDICHGPWWVELQCPLYRMLAWSAASKQADLFRVSHIMRLKPKWRMRLKVMLFS